MLDALPLTSSGKIDRKALPAPAESETLAPASAYVAPRTPVEETLAAIWAQVLGRSRVGVHDNFFELGGHSLLATQGVARVRNAFNLNLSLISLFQAPTIKTFAKQLQTTMVANRPPLKPSRGIDGREALKANVAQMSDGEIEEMLKKLGN